jgi:hypothetical protein
VEEVLRGKNRLPKEAIRESHYYKRALKAKKHQLRQKRKSCLRARSHTWMPDSGGAYSSHGPRHLLR